MVGKIVQSITALTAIGALVFTARSLDYTAEAARATRDQLRITEQGQITDRFARSVEQLGSDKIDVRLGAIHALERVMRDSPADQPTVLEILTAYVRQRVPTTSSLAQAASPAPNSPMPLGRPATDVAAAVTVLGRRNAAHDTAGEHPDLSNLVFSNADLRNVKLSTVNLSAADLHHSDLFRVDLHGADLSAADLHGSGLSEADVHDADLRQANLHGSSLRQADLRNADLRSADLFGADLFGADLSGANLNYANLRSADLFNVKGVTSETVRCSFIDDQTHLPKGILRPISDTAVSRSCS